MTRLFHDKKNCRLRHLSHAARCGLICMNCFACVCGRCFDATKPRYESHNGINYPTGEIPVPEGV